MQWSSERIIQLTTVRSTMEISDRRKSVSGVLLPTTEYHSSSTLEKAVYKDLRDQGIKEFLKVIMKNCKITQKKIEEAQISAKKYNDAMAAAEKRSIELSKIAQEKGTEIAKQQAAEAAKQFKEAAEAAGEATDKLMKYSEEALQKISEEAVEIWDRLKAGIEFKW